MFLKGKENFYFVKKNLPEILNSEQDNNAFQQNLELYIISN